MPALVKLKPEYGFRKRYSGSYGTTGFKLTFADNTSFGDDTSGGTNDFTDNNFGTDHQVTDTPTNNFCTINAQNCHGSMTIGQGGLYSFWGSASWLSGMFSFGPIKSGKWYFEGKQLTTHSTTRRMMIGIGDAGKVSGMALKNNYYIGQGAAGIDFSIYYNYDSGGGSDYRSVTAGGGTTEASLGTPAQNDVLQVAFDADNNKMWIGKNNTWIGDPGAGTGETFNNATDSLDFQLYDYVPWTFSFMTMSHALQTGIRDRNFILGKVVMVILLILHLQAFYQWHMQTFLSRE
jgi:hypothetical protein